MGLWPRKRAKPFCRVRVDTPESAASSARVTASSRWLSMYARARDVQRQRLPAVGAQRVAVMRQLHQQQ